MDGSYEYHKKVHFGVDGKRNLELEEIDIMSVVDSSFVYPSFKSLKDKEVAEISSKLIFHYKCDSNKCEFPITALRDSAELKSIGIKETTDIIVSTIDAHQQLFTARQCGGYILQAAGKSMVLVQNDSVVPNDETRFGFVDLTETRRRLIHQYELTRLRKSQSEIKAPSSPAAHWSNFGTAMGGGLAGSAVVLGARFLMDLARRK